MKNKLPEFNFEKSGCSIDDNLVYAFIVWPLGLNYCISYTPENTGLFNIRLS